MNKDFHYYGTYVAARLAGYDFKSAELLAYAAQYVDDSESSRLKDENQNYYVKDFTPVPTVQPVGELLKNDMKWTEQYLDETYRVWPVFHFLPGNYDENGNYKKAYGGVLTDKGTLASWTYDAEAKEQYKLMCLPNSSLVKKMINDLDNRSPLHEVGLRMHTLADTWAHMYYAGVAAWFINDVSEGGGAPYLRKMPYYNSFAFLGHGCCGHYPDYPYLNFTFKIQWSAEKITKNNTADFMLAIKQLVEAMKCIRESKPFDVDKYAQIDPAAEAVINKVFKTHQDDQSGEWKKRIPEIKIKGVSLEVPADYNPDKWLKEAKEDLKNIKNTDYYKFNLAAVNHLHFVKNALSQDDIFLDNVPESRIVRCKAKSQDNKYISNAEFDKYPYPVLGNNPALLEIILPNDQPLSAGTNVKIRTTETTASFKDMKYLGAWKTPSLYYYTKDYNLFKQKWSIEQSGKPEGSSIDMSHPVSVKNKEYLSKPFMAPYQTTYLTTKASDYLFNLEVLPPATSLLLLDTYGSGLSDAYLNQVNLGTAAFVRESRSREQFAVIACDKYGASIYPEGTEPALATVSSDLHETQEAEVSLAAYKPIRNESNLEGAIKIGNTMLGEHPLRSSLVYFTFGLSIPVGLDPERELKSETPFFVHGSGPFVTKSTYEKLLNKNPDSLYFHSEDASGVVKQYNYIRAKATNCRLVTNQVDTYKGSNYQKVESLVTTKTGEVQFTVVWSDSKYQYSNAAIDAEKINVYLIDPSGKRCSNKPDITGAGYCIFNLRDAIPGKWFTIVEYSVKEEVTGTVGVFEFGSSLRMEMDLPVTSALDEPLAFSVRVFDYDVPLDSLRLETRVTSPLLSVDNALANYDGQLESSSSDAIERSADDQDEIPRLQSLRMRNIHEKDLLGTQSSTLSLRRSRKGIYKGILKNTLQAGSYTIEVKASGKHPVTGEPVVLIQSRSVLIG